MFVPIDFMFNESKSHAEVATLLSMSKISNQRLLEITIFGWPDETVSDVVAVRRKYLAYLWEAQQQLIKKLMRVHELAKQFTLFPVSSIRPWKFKLLQHGESNALGIFKNMKKQLKILKQKTHLDKFTYGAVLNVNVIIWNARNYRNSLLNHNNIPNDIRKSLGTKQYKIIICTGIKTPGHYDIIDHFSLDIRCMPHMFTLVTCEYDLSPLQLLLIYSSLFSLRKLKNVIRIPCYSALRIDENSVKMFNDLTEFDSWDETNKKSST